MAYSVNAYPSFRRNESEDERVGKLNKLLSGKVNAYSGTGIFTLNASVTATGLTDSLIAASSFVDFRALTAAASSAQGTMYIISQTNGAVTVGHISSAATTATFRYVVFG